MIVYSESDSRCKLKAASCTQGLDTNSKTYTSVIANSSGTYESITGIFTTAFDCAAMSPTLTSTLDGFKDETVALTVNLGAGGSTNIYPF